MSANFKKDYGWQERAVDALMTGITDFYSSTPGGFAHAFIAEVSPSGGKTKFSLKAAKAMMAAGLIDKAFWVVPRETIKDGFKDDAADTGLRIDTNLDTNYNGRLRNYDGAVINYQSLGRFAEYLGLLSRAGMKLLVVFDEVHHGRTGDGQDDACSGTWGKAMEDVRSAACAIICMTGTPVRADKELVPYLRYEDAEQIDPMRCETKTVLYVRPDFKFSYKMAIESGVARKLIFRPQAPTVSFRYGRNDDETEFVGTLNEVPRFLIDRAKKQLLSPSDGHIDDMLRLALNENTLDRKIGDAEAAILVVVGSSDDEKGYNPLTHVASRIRQLCGEVAVTVESSDGPAAAQEVKAFKKSTARWIVAKDMISEGTSIPRIRTILILRDIKSSVKFQQTVHRATRNRSDDFPQDAKVIFFHLPEMVSFASAIEREIELLVRPDPIHCPGCEQQIEYRPRRGLPCSFCGYEPEGSDKDESGIEFEWLFSEFGEQVVIQGGDDFSRYDPVSFKLLNNLGQNPYYGARSGINELLRNADETGMIALLDNPSEQSNQVPFSDEELCDRYWEAGLKACRTAAAIICANEAVEKGKTNSQVTAQCKRAAGMGRDSHETVRRDYKDPVGTFRKFSEAAKQALARAQQRYGR